MIFFPLTHLIGTGHTPPGENRRWADRRGLSAPNSHFKVKEKGQKGAYVQGSQSAENMLVGSQCPVPLCVNYVQAFPNEGI